MTIISLEQESSEYNSRVSNLLSRFEKETTKIEQHWLDVAVEMLRWENEFSVDDLVVNGTIFNEDILRLPDHVFSELKARWQKEGWNIEVDGANTKRKCS